MFVNALFVRVNYSAFRTGECISVFVLNDDELSVLKKVTASMMPYTSRFRSVTFSLAEDTGFSRLCSLP